MSKSKRKFKRIGVNEMVLSRDTSLIRDTIKNISGNGCFIQTSNEFNIGDIYQLVFDLKNSNNSIKVTGEIVWEYKPGKDSVSSDSENHGYGVKFVEINPDEVQKIIDAIIYFKVEKIYS